MSSPVLSYEFIHSFDGDLRQISSLIGFYNFTMLYGWRVSRLVHSKATYKKYCQLLTLGGVKQEFPEYTDASYMCLGIRDINRDSLPYWSVVSGKIKLKNKHLSNTPNW